MTSIGVHPTKPIEIYVVEFPEGASGPFSILKIASGKTEISIFSYNEVERERFRLIAIAAQTVEAEGV